MDAVAFVGAAFDDLPEEDDLVVPLADGDVVVAQARHPRGEFGQLVVVRSEEGLRTDLVVEVLDDAPREREAVEGARAAPNLIEDDEAAGGGVVEDVRRLAHLHHERALPPREVVARADAGKDAVHEIHARGRGGEEAAGVREQSEQRDLADVSGFARHVWAGDQGDLRRRSGRRPACRYGGKLGVIRHEALLGQRLVEDGVARVAEQQLPGVGDFRPRVVEVTRGLGEARERVEIRQCGGGLLDGSEAADDLFAHAEE